MKPQKPPAQEPDGLFKTPLERFIDMQHPLVRLAERIDWDSLDTQIAGCFGQAGRPAVPTRFMLGMLILKATYNLSDEALFDRWPCDPYFQFFTGELYFQYQVPHERSGLSHWRNRLGADVLDALLRESLTVAQKAGALSERDMEAVTVDTTVQEKAVRFPTDAALLYTALVKLGAEARTSGIKLRQSYRRLGKRAQIMAGRYAHAKQYKRMRKQLKFLKTRLGRVVRDIERNIESNPEKQAVFAESLRKARIIGAQALNRRAKPKIYSWHAPEVECIGKGKARAPYEFGCKATITTTNGRAKGGMFILHADALHGNPFDGHTLGEVLKQTATLTGITPKRAHVDRGYRGHKQNLHTPDPATGQPTRPPWRVFISGRKTLKPNLKAELKRRSAIEPVIGHMKADHRMGRNHLKTRSGDRFNVKMAAIGFNFRRILKWLETLVSWLLLWLRWNLAKPMKMAVC
ncbi:MAG: IS5 family transposase [Caldithrix sp.]|nr:MAG: IS5 family transposase [Caldithrix sp.]